MEDGRLETNFTRLQKQKKKLADSTYLEESLEAALLDSLGGQDVGQLRVGVRYQEAGGHKLPDELGDLGLRARRQGRGRREGAQMLQLAALAWK